MELSFWLDLNRIRCWCSWLQFLIISSWYDHNQAAVWPVTRCSSGAGRLMGLLAPSSCSLVQLVALSLLGVIYQVDVHCCSESSCCQRKRQMGRDEGGSKTLHMFSISSKPKCTVFLSERPCEWSVAVILSNRTCPSETFASLTFGTKVNNQEDWGQRARNKMAALQICRLTGRKDTKEKKQVKIC